MVPDSRWIPRKTAIRKQIGAPRLRKALNLLRSEHARVEVPKNGNWLFYAPKHCVAPSGDALWHGLKILTLETPSVIYGFSAAATNPKSEHLGTRGNLLAPSCL